MFHVKHISSLKIHELLFYVFLLVIPFQTRIIYQPQSAYIGWYFNYHLAFFVYLSDLILVSCFIAWFIFERPKITLDKVFWLILAFFILILASMFRVKHLNLAIYGVFKWVELLLLVLYVRETFRETFQFRIIAYLLFLGGAIQAVLAIGQFHVQHMVGLTWLGEYIPAMGVSGLATIETLAGKVIRAYGTFSHPNVLAGFLILALFMALYLVSRETKFHPRESGDPRNGPRTKSGVAALGLLIITLGIFVTFSRLAWLAAGIGYLGFALYWLWDKQWSKVMVIVIVAIVSSGTIWFGYYGFLKARILDANQISIADRGFFNDLGLKLISEHPTFGVGVGNYVPATEDLVKLPDWQYQPPHNIFIFIAAELGIAALAIFILLLWEIIRRVKNVFPSPLAFTFYFLLFTFLVLGQFDHYFVTIQQGQLVFFVLLGLLAALPNLKSDNTQS